MNVNDIIVLDDNEKFCILEELIKNNERYFMCAEVDEEDNINRKKLSFLREITKRGENYVEIIKEGKDIDRLAKAFMQKIKDAD